MDIIKYKEKGKTKQEAQKLMNSRFQLDLEIRCICDRTLIKTESQKSFDYTNPNNKKCRTNIFEALFNGMILNLLWEWVHDRICAYLDRILVRLILEIDAWKKKKMELIAQWVEMVSVGVLRFFYKSSAFPWNIYATKVGKLKKYLVKI